MKVEGDLVDMVYTDKKHPEDLNIEQVLPETIPMHQVEETEPAKHYM